MCCLHHRWKFLFLNWFVGFFLFQRVRLRSLLDCSQTAGRDNVTVQHDPTTSNLTDKQWTHVTWGVATSQLSQNTGFVKVWLVREMLDGAEQGLCPHHEVKLTFMKLTKVTGWLSVCRYGFTRQYCSVLLLLQTWCVLFSLPAREGWNAWKRHYCALTWPTVNGWVKVPFEMYVISKKKKKKKRAQQNLVHVSRYTPLG